MITAVFWRKKSSYRAFALSGHAGFAEYGKDVVCAAVSSAAMLTVNTVTDFINDVNAEVSCEENKIKLVLKKPSENSEKMLESFYTHLKILAEQHKGTIRIKVTEV